MKIRKETFNKYVEDNVFENISQNRLISDGEKVMVGVSGGKDSILTLHMLHQYREKSSIDYFLEAVCVDEGILGYREDGIKTAIHNCEKLDVPLTLVSFKDEWNYTLDEISDVYKSSCMPCGIYRRYLLNKTAYTHDCDKIATGHNMDDEIQSFLMTIARNDYNKFSKFGPALDRIHEKMIPRIKPLWQLPEKDVGIWCILNDIPIHDEECPYSATSLRSEVKNYLNKLEEEKKGTKQNMFNSFKKTLRLAKREVSLDTCEYCGQATAISPCNACTLTRELNKLL